MKQLLFRCIVKLDERTALVFQYCSTSRINIYKNDEPEPVFHLGGARVLANGSDVGFSDKNGTLDFISYSKAPIAIKNTAYDLCKDWHDGFLESFTDTGYFNFKKELFNLLDLAERTKAADPSSHVNCYYAVIKDVFSRAAHDLITGPEVLKFLKTGEL